MADDKQRDVLPETEISERMDRAVRRMIAAPPQPRETAKKQTKKPPKSNAGKTKGRDR
jgi:hypothetical protein